jgi:hypothetical protein
MEHPVIVAVELPEAGVVLVGAVVPEEAVAEGDNRSHSILNQSEMNWGIGSNRCRN